MSEKSDHQLRVEAFHRTQTKDRPTLPSAAERLLRARLILEEALETIQALGFYLGAARDLREDSESHYNTEDEQLAAIADGCADLIVVATGTLSTCGLKDKPILRMVDENNLAKLGPGGWIRDDGKIMKPEGHTPPDILGEIKRQRKAT